jgi:hypothetical protein
MTKSRPTTRDCAKRVFEYIINNRRGFLRNVRVDDGVLKVTTTMLKSLALELCGRDLSKGGGVGRLIRALTAIARRRGYAVGYIIARRPTKTERKTLYLKPRAKTKVKSSID